MSQPKRIKLQGGGSTQALRDSILRKTGAWSPFVHQLLQHLHATGFAEAPLVLEANDGWERLSFIDGEAGNDPLKPYMQSDAILVEAATLLRRLHDATQDFMPPADAVFQLPLPDMPHEVICHNDFAPYNCIFRDQGIVGIIDFDTAAPGSRLWDIAYAVYRFAPLSTPSHARALGWQPLPDQAQRLRLFCDAYGLHDRAGLMAVLIERLQALMRYMQANAFNLDHLPLYAADLNYIRENIDPFTAALRER